MTSSRIAVSGNKHLKRSQAYPKAYGKAVVKVYKMNELEFKHTAWSNARMARSEVVDVPALFDIIRTNGKAASDMWKDAGFDVLIRYLTQARC
jgi:hypothetical protein